MTVRSVCCLYPRWHFPEKLYDSAKFQPSALSCFLLFVLQGQSKAAQKLKTKNISSLGKMFIAEEHGL